MSRYSATLVEVIIALVLISLLAAGFSLGWVRHRHRVTFSRSMRSVQGLVDQAHVLCTAAGQEVHIVLKQYDAQLQVLVLPYLDISDKGKRTKVHQLMQRYTQDQTFFGVKDMEINGDQVHEIHLALYPQQGLASVLADSKELIVTGPTQQTFRLVMQATGDGSTFPISLDALFFRHQTEKAFPDEYVQQPT